MGLIYVNPEGPDGNPDGRSASAPRVRRNLRAHGHERRRDRRTRRRRTHVRQVPWRRTCLPMWGLSPKPPPSKGQGLGWKSSFRSGKGGDRSAAASRAPGSRTRPNGTWRYLKVLFKYEWELVKSPAGANQWLAKNVAEEDMVVDAARPQKKPPADDDHGGSLPSFRPASTNRSRGAICRTPSNSPTPSLGRGSS